MLPTSETTNIKCSKWDFYLSARLRVVAQDTLLSLHIINLMSTIISAPKTKLKAPMLRIILKHVWHSQLPGFLANPWPCKMFHTETKPGWMWELKGHYLTRSLLTGWGVNISPKIKGWFVPKLPNSPVNAGLSGVGLPWKFKLKVNTLCFLKLKYIHGGLVLSSFVGNII